MSIVDILPPSLLVIEAKDIVLELIRAFPIEREDKKAHAQEWAERVGVSLTREDYVRAGAELPEEVGL
jgi:hypothetical protein